MRSLIDTLSPALAARELTEEIRLLFDELEQAGVVAPHAGECRPAVDVLETDDRFEIVVDLPGVPAKAIKVLLKDAVVLVAGEKIPQDAAARAGADFHLVERGFGRFARAVRLRGAIDGARARARLTGGELRVVIPKMAERRGQPITVPIDTNPEPTPER